MTTAICAFMKKENQFIDEWLSYHISIGIDKFVIFDNNDGFEDYPMTEYVSRQAAAKRVKIINRRNVKLDKEKDIKMIYDSCRTDWICFLDIDEFIYVEDGLSIKDALSKECYAGCSNIVMPSIVYSDTNNIYCDENHTVINRFSEISVFKSKYANILKSFIKTGISKYDKISPQGILKHGLISVTSSGNSISLEYPMIKFSDVYPIVIHSYPTKSLEEYCTIKMPRSTGYDKTKIEEYKEKYFSVNKRTADKEALFDAFINTTYDTDETTERMHSYAEFNFGDGQSDNAD